MTQNLSLLYHQIGKPDKNNISNFRPVSLLNIFSKFYKQFYERVVKDQLVLSKKTINHQWYLLIENLYHAACCNSPSKSSPTRGGFLSQVGFGLPCYTEQGSIIPRRLVQVGQLYSEQGRAIPSRLFQVGQCYSKQQAIQSEIIPSRTYSEQGHYSKQVIPSRGALSRCFSNKKGGKFIFLLIP